jgi:triosephosphate isomerase
MNKTIYFIANWKMNGNYNSIKEIEKVAVLLKKKEQPQIQKNHILSTIKFIKLF